MMGRFNSIRKNLRDRLTSYKPLIDAGLSPEFIGNLRRGWFLVPEDVLCQGIARVVAEEEGIALLSCVFDTDGIHLDLQARRMGAIVTFPLKIVITGIAVTPHEQKIEFKFSGDKPVGGNLPGRIASAVAGGLLSKMLTKRISTNSLVLKSETYQRIHTVRIDISGIEKLQSLKRQIPVLNRSALDFFSIEHHEHAPGGIKLRGRISLDLRKNPESESKIS